MSFPSWIKSHTEKLEQSGVLRRPRTLARSGAKIILDGRPVLNLASNDYLALSADNRLKHGVKSAVESEGVGSCSARLLCGTTPLHTALESCLAEWCGREAAVLFSSGYLANIGAVSAGRGRNDHVFADRLAHASLIDGIRISGMKHHRFHHNDLDDLERLLKVVQRSEGRRLVVTESVFSMNGDRAPVEAIADLAAHYGADLLVDEAHALGIFPTTRRGEMVTGTLSKACGSYGGFVSGCAELPPFLHSLSRPFIFNTSLPPALCAASLEAVRILGEEPALGQSLLARAERFRLRLESAGLNCLGSTSQIVPVFVGDSEKAALLSAALVSRGIFAPHIRPPTVPPNEERIRFSLTLALSEEETAEAADVIIDAAREVGIC